MSGGLILAAKPEDADDVQAVFRKAGRRGDLIVFNAQDDRRCNFLGCLKTPRDVVQFLMTQSEIMKRGDGKGGESSRFYEVQEERFDYMAVSALQAAGEPVTSANLHKFIMTAAHTPAELMTPEWRQQYHSQILDRGFNAQKMPVQQHDYQLCLDFWIKEWAGMLDERTRGNTLATAQGTLSLLNTGLVREMVAGETNCSPQDVLNGKWILVNFPPSTYGQAGKLISTGWKQLVQQAILAQGYGAFSVLRYLV